jgi:hypothetical protein
MNLLLKVTCAAVLAVSLAQKAMADPDQTAADSVTRWLLKTSATDPWT